MLSISTFLHQLINHSTYGFIKTMSFLRSIIVCFITLNINSNIHTATHGTLNIPKKWISDFRDPLSRYLLLNYSKFSTDCCNPYKPYIYIYISYIICTIVINQNRGIFLNCTHIQNNTKNTIYIIDFLKVSYTYPYSNFQPNAETKFCSY